MKNDRFLRACQLEEVDCTPIWLMRQAGRYMQEYRKIREKHTFLEMCKNPKLAAEITLQPVKKLGVDAAILFSDILVPVEAMGAKIEFTEKRGPVIHNAAENLRDIESLETGIEKKVDFVSEEIKVLKNKLEVPLVGFSGAPFTLASYLVEGGGSVNYIKTKTMMYREPKLFASLMNKLAEAVIRYLFVQIDAGVDALQIFDTWAGYLSPEDYEKFALPYTKKIISALKKENVPIINFAKDGASLLELRKRAGGNVIGIDWRVNLDEAWKKIGYNFAIQGNLDPVALFAGRKEIERQAKEILKRAENRNGHIFNLGHGILPETPVENVMALVKAVHRHSAR